MLTHWLRHDEIAEHGTESPRLDAAVRGGVIQAYSGDHGLNAGRADDVLHSVGGTLRMAIAKHARGEEQPVAQVGVLADSDFTSREVGRVLQAHGHRRVQSTDLHQHYREGSALPENLNRFDVLVIQHAPDSPLGRDGVRMARQVREAGFGGRIVLLNNRERFEGHYEEALRTAREQGVHNAEVFHNSMWSRPELLAHAVDAQLNEQKPVPDKDAPRKLEEARQKALAEWGLDEKLAKLARRENEWPQALRLSNTDVRGLEAQVRDAANSFAPKGDLSYPVFAQALDARWNDGLKALLEPKKRWDNAKGKPRAITNEEKAQATREASAQHTQDEDPMRGWQRQYERRYSGKMSDWNNDDREQAFPYLQRAQSGGLVDYSAAQKEALQQVVASGQRYADFDAFSTDVHRQVARRVVDMLASAKRLDGDIAQREALEDKVVMALVRNAPLPARMVPTAQEKAIAKDEVLEVERNDGRTRYPDMPTRWVERARSELGIGQNFVLKL